MAKALKNIKHNLEIETQTSESMYATVGPLPTVITYF